MANRFLVPGGNGLANSTTNWSATSGGLSGVSVPGSADDVIFDAGSANVTLTVSAAQSFKSFMVSNYTGILTINNVLSIVGTGLLGNITLSSGMTINGSGTLFRTVTSGNLTSNGVKIGCNIFQTTDIIILIDNARCINYLASNSSIINGVGKKLSIEGDCVLGTGSGRSLTGATYEFIGSNTATFTVSTTQFFTGNLTFNKTGILNIGSFIINQSNSIKYTHIQGIVNHTGTLSFNSIFTNINCIFDTSGMKWNILKIGINASSSSSLAINITLNSTLKALLFDASLFNKPIIFKGTSGFDIDTFKLEKASISYRYAAAFLNLTSGLIYNINILARFKNASISSSIPGTKSILRLLPSTSTFFYNNTITDIDASTDKQIRNFYGSITGCSNVISITSNMYNKSNNF